MISERNCVEPLRRSGSVRKYLVNDARKIDAARGTATRKMRFECAAGRRSRRGLYLREGKRLSAGICSGQGGAEGGSKKNLERRRSMPSDAAKEVIDGAGPCVESAVKTATQGKSDSGDLGGARKKA